MKYTVGLQKYHNLSEKINAKISSWSVGEHVDHGYNVAIGIIGILQKSGPSTRRESMSPLKLLSLTMGFIPRGKAKAPPVVMPSTNISVPGLDEKFERYQEMQKIIPGIPTNHWMEHPVFGILHKSSAIRFIEVHSKHHTKIIRDILG